jgi:hypothetical protein
MMNARVVPESRRNGALIVQNDFDAVVSSRPQSQVLSAMEGTSPPPTEPFAAPPIVAKPSQQAAAAPNKRSPSQSSTHPGSSSATEVSKVAPEVVTRPGLRVRTSAQGAGAQVATSPDGVGTRFESAAAGLRPSSGRRSSLKGTGVLLVACMWYIP